MRNIAELFSVRPAALSTPNRRRVSVFSMALALLSSLFASSDVRGDEVDFNRDVRPILSNRCFACHGPDDAAAEASLRLDSLEFATAEADSGERAIVPGRVQESELLRRIRHEDEEMRMPPAATGEPLSDAEVDLLRRWIEQGASFAKHWSYELPIASAPPRAAEPYADWPRNAIDHFVLRRMRENGLKPTREADRYALGRRLFLDLTGLPPTPEEIDEFVNDKSPDAYEKLVEDLLKRKTYGEHWARNWLDLARYADSSGYADDPPRTIWGYRDWVIRAFNRNMPFDQFTIEQLAGDLLPNATQDQLIATAFHRNTLTNNEGGTQDEEFRNVAIVDRVNTTLAVWMGTTIACAQCHNHKYDPITQEEYFELFAIFNNTEDADRRDESPTIGVYSTEARQKQKQLKREIEVLRERLSKSTPSLVRAQEAWESALRETPEWKLWVPSEVSRGSGKPATIEPSGHVKIVEAVENDRTELTLDVVKRANVTALQLQTIPLEELPRGGSGLAGGNFVVTGVTVQKRVTAQTPPLAKFLRVTNRGKRQLLSLAEVQVFSEGVNIALKGKASQISTDYNGQANLAIDGNTDGDYEHRSVTHTAFADEPWWELRFAETTRVDQIVIWNRTDNNLQSRLKGFDVELLDANRKPIWKRYLDDAPDPSTELSPTGWQAIPIAFATADYHQPDFEPGDVLARNAGPKDGWAVGGQVDKPHALTLVFPESVEVSEQTQMRITIEHDSPHKNHLLGSFKVRSTGSLAALQGVELPKRLRHILQKEVAARSVSETEQLRQYFRSKVAKELADPRRDLSEALAKLEAIKPMTTVPVQRELGTKQRQTWIQIRGNYLAKGPQVKPGTPDALHVMNAKRVDRLSLGRWLVAPENPLTSRVLVNRYWESLFGRGIVATSEEFGSQGELPTHPELLDWLAVNVQKNGWDLHSLLRLIVTSATYRQAVEVDDDLIRKDPDNRWLSRGPRVRHSAEMIRDQALASSGLISDKMFGPPVKPPQPEVGLRAAFGGSTDWKTSDGEDRYRRGIYTTWRRSNPYPSMATFDAPNREVCTIRRNQTNTPLQSLVTLNDPVFVEAAQALARRMLRHKGGLEEQLNYGIRLTLARHATQAEKRILAQLFDDAKKKYDGDRVAAHALATEPLGELPVSLDTIDAAAMTVVANVLLNLDETLLKR